MIFFSYTDHRILIRDLYKLKRSESKAFSHRAISQKLGNSSPSFLLHIISGRVKIHEELAEKLIKLFKLSNREADYFRKLINFNQAKSPEEKRFWLQEMHQFMGLNVKLTKPNQYEFYQKWYYTAIWAAIGFYNFKGNYKELAEFLRPSISTYSAKKAVELLLDLNLIKIDSSGKYTQVDPIISTGDSAVSVSLSTFHLEMIDLAQKAIDSFPREEREFSTLTLALSENTLRETMKEMRKCRTKILSLIKEENEADRVYQFNFQVFPLTTTDKRKPQ